MFGFLRNRGKSEHEWVEESLSAYLDGELSAKDTARTEKHLHECLACVENLATLRQTVALLKELPAVPAPRSFAIRPEPVRPKVRAAAPAWGYGLLKGATALAALLLVMLIGGDLALQFLGGFRLAAPPPLAPAAEVALAPSPLPSVSPPGAEQELIVGEGKAMESPTEEPPPLNAEQLPPPAAAVTETDEAYLAPPPAETVAPVSERPAGAEAAGTPTAAATPVGTPMPEEQDVERERAEPTAVPMPTATPPAVAVAELPSEEIQARGEGRLQPGALVLLPLRVAELAVFIALLILIPTTILTGWVIRKRG